MSFSTNLFQYRPIYQGEAVKEYDDYITEAVKTYDTAQNNATLLNKTLASYKANALPGQHQYIDEVMKAVNGSLEKIATDVHGGKRWEGALSQVNDLAMTLAGDPHLEVISESYKNYVDAKKEEQRLVSQGHTPYMIGDNPDTYNSLDRPFKAVVTPKGDWLNFIEDEARLVAPQITSEVDLAQSKPGYLVFKTTAGNARLRTLKDEIKGNFKLSAAYNNLKAIYDQTGKSDQIEKDIDAMIDNKVNLMVYENSKLDLDRIGTDSKTAADNPSAIEPNAFSTGKSNVQPQEPLTEKDFVTSKPSSIINKAVGTAAIGLLGNKFGKNFADVLNGEKQGDVVPKGIKEAKRIYKMLPDGQLKTELDANMKAGNFKRAAEIINEITGQERSTLNYQVDFTTHSINTDGLKESMKSQFTDNVGIINDEPVKGAWSVALGTAYANTIPGLDRKAAIKDVSENLDDFTVNGIDMSTGNIEGTYRGSVKFSVPASNEMKQIVGSYQPAIKKIKESKLNSRGEVEFMIPLEETGQYIPVRAYYSKQLGADGTIQIHIVPDKSGLTPFQVQALKEKGLNDMSGTDLINLSVQAIKQSNFIKTLPQKK